MKTLLAIVVCVVCGYCLANMAIGKVVQTLDNVKVATKIK